MSQNKDRLVLTQYQTLTSRAALLERPEVGKLRLQGKDTIDLLDRLSTNDLTKLSSNLGASTVLTTNKGRIIDRLIVSHLGTYLLVSCSRAATDRISQWIDFYTFDEDVVVVNDNRTFTISIAGPDAVEVVDDLTGDVAGDLPKYGAIEVSIKGLDVVVVRSDFLNSIAFDFIASEGDRQNLKQALEKRVGPVGPDTLEAVRIERGIPSFGNELNEDHNPLEAGLIDSVDFNKGCYIGQEVVARLNTYNKVQRRLIVLQWTGGSVLPGNEVKGKDGKVGVVTSVAQHPHGGFVGLAYVKRSFMDDGVAIGPSGILATIRPAG